MQRTEYFLIPLLDLTSLNESDTVEKIHELCQKAQTPQGPVAAVCIYPKFVVDACSQLKDSTIAVATVANFPQGNDPLETTQNEIKKSIANGAQEIDIVFPYEKYLQGNHAEVLENIESYRESCGKNIILKIILETGALNHPDLISIATELAIEGGADFIKTSTGKIANGATLDAARAILEVIKQYKAKKVGIKISGGVRSVLEAMQYVELTAKVLGEEWISPRTMRFGASQLLDDILNIR